MPEYIEREALKKRIRLLPRFAPHNTVSYSSVQRAIFDAPKVDVVEVVRCKDCLFSFKEPAYEHGYMCYKGVYHPCIGETRHRKLVQDCDFCSFGKRKKGAEE